MAILNCKKHGQNFQDVYGCPDCTAPATVNYGDLWRAVERLGADAIVRNIARICTDLGRQTRGVKSTQWESAAAILEQVKLPI